MIGWLTVFKAIPWTDVLRAAPAVARGARKLWDAHEGSGRPAEVVSRVGEDSDVETRLRQLEAQVARLSTEAVAAAELVDSLAEQNARLVEAVDILRVRTRILAVVCAGGIGRAGDPGVAAGRLVATGGRCQNFILSSSFSDYCIGASCSG